MASPFHLLLLISSLSSIPFSESALTVDYYAKTCPRFEDIVLEESQTRLMNHAATAAATLRVFFHDCMVEGCDASVLIKSTAFNKAERDADVNLSLGADTFELVNRIKARLENECPGIVSCADILASATRSLVRLVGGPQFKVRYGRKDGFVSQASHVEGHFTTPNMTMDKIISIFQAHRFTIQEMVALVGGGHTIGFAHCDQIASRIFGAKPDPGLHPLYAAKLKETCFDYTTNPGKAVYLDVIEPGKFGNTIFSSMQKGLAVLASDGALFSDPRTKPFVEKYAIDQEAFFRDFAHAMQKVSIYGVKTGRKGEVRRTCDAFNNPQV